MIYCNSCNREPEEPIIIGENESEALVCKYCKSDNIYLLNNKKTPDNDTLSTNSKPPQFNPHRYDKI